jgi:hypothetical protein
MKLATVIAVLAIDVSTAGQLAAGLIQSATISGETIPGFAGTVLAPLLRGSDLAIDPLAPGLTSEALLASAAGEPGVRDLAALASAGSPRAPEDKPWTGRGLLRIALAGATAVLTLALVGVIAKMVALRRSV